MNPAASRPRVAGSLDVLLASRKRRRSPVPLTSKQPKNIEDHRRELPRFRFSNSFEMIRFARGRQSCCFDDVANFSIRTATGWEMTGGANKKVTAADVLRRYREDILLEFLDLPLDDVNQRGHFGDRPIHIAAFRGAVDDLRALIEGGADMNSQGDRDFTPLHSAVLDNQIDAVKFLLEMGVNQQLTDDDGRTALGLAKSMGHDDIVKLLE